MNTVVTRAIYHLVAKARTAYQATKNTHSKEVEYAEHVINTKYRNNTEELRAMEELRYLRVLSNHVYVLLA